MLKVTYTESGLHLEHLTQSLEEWIARRVVLALRTNQRLIIEHSTASILLSAGLNELAVLETAAHRETIDNIKLSACDNEHVEVSLEGIWVTSSSDEAEGIFIAILAPKTEQILFHLWQLSQRETFPLWR